MDTVDATTVIFHPHTKKKTPFDVYSIKHFNPCINHTHDTYSKSDFFLFSCKTFDVCQLSGDNKSESDVLLRGISQKPVFV